MLARFFQRLVNSLRYGTRLGPLIGRFQPWDDFYWPRYNKDFYRREISRVGYLDRLSETSWSIENARIIVSSKRDLHPNHRLIYETALNLRPRAITEIGCGGGDHLANLKLLLPEVYLVGFDVSADQLEFARERNFANDGVVRSCLYELRVDAHPRWKTSRTFCAEHGRDIPTLHSARGKLVAS